MKLSVDDSRLISTVCEDRVSFTSVGVQVSVLYCLDPDVTVWGHLGSLLPDSRDPSGLTWRLQDVTWRE